MISTLPENRAASPSLFPRCLTLKAVRLSRDWTEYYVSAKTGISRGYLHQFENGKCKTWPAAIAKLCAFFELCESDLFPELNLVSRSGPLYPPCATLKNKRIEQDLTQHALAMRSGVNSNYISRFETGDRKPWSAAIEKLCNALESTEEDLFPEIQEFHSLRIREFLNPKVGRKPEPIGRLAWYMGEDSPVSKLTEVEVQEIRWLNQHKRLTYKELAEMFNVSMGTIEGVIMGDTWTHVPDELL